MKKWYSVAIMVVITALVVGMAVAPKPAQAQEPIIIKIGLPTPLSGPAAPWSTIPIPAYDTFVELFNKAGGVKVGGKTYHFKMIYIDDKNTPEGGAAAAKQLIYSEGCKFIAGHWSWNFPAVAAVTNPAKVIFITRTGNEAVPGGVYDPKKMPYVVFASPSDEEFLIDALAIVETFPQYKRIGMADSTLGKGPGWDYVDRGLDAAGVRYHHEWYTPGTQDFTPYITRFAQAGCDIIFTGGDVGAALQIIKQRWEMGYKTMKVGHSGPILTPRMYTGICGFDAAQGVMGSYYACWNFKKTKVNPKYVKMCKEVMKIVSKKQGSPYLYTGWIGWVPSHLLILAQAMEKASTVDDPDAIMAAIRGGTFSTTTGTYTMSGEKTYGSPVVFGCPGALSILKGDKEVYLGEHPWKPIP